MTTPKNSKDLKLINCQEIPETICVETRFITQSGMQKNMEQMYFPNNKGGSELNKDELQSKTKKFVSIKPKLVEAATSATIQQCKLPQQPQSGNTFIQTVMPLTNLSSNLSTLTPARGAQLNSTSQLQTFNLQNSLLATSQLGAYTVQNMSNISGYSSEQMQQIDTSCITTESIGIQCELDAEIEDLSDISNDCNNDCKDSENEIESFLRFVKENSVQHKIYKECLICGELCKPNKYFYGHMAAHRGPKSLCFKCGRCLEHEHLQPHHNCQKSRQLEEAFLKCPHFSCDVTAISPLELYDHINEHSNARIYKCSACQKAFCTRQEFLRHILIRPKCYTSSKRTRFRLYGLESQKDLKCRVRVFNLHTYKKCITLVKAFLSQRAKRKGVCRICFKRISNEYLYKRHRVVCIGKFKRRLMKKRQKQKRS